MRYVRCDDLAKDWSVLTLGCWQLAPSEGWGDVCPPADADAVVKAALDCGITAFDTAEGYGDGESERRLGRALGHKKDDVIIVSKIWPDAELTLAAYQRRLEGTLRALGRDYVDVYLVHWPGAYFNTKEKSQKLCELMFGLKAGGKAKRVGLSNFHARDLALLGERIARFSINQVPYSLLERKYEGESAERCRDAEIKFMAYSPTARGLLAGRIDREALKPEARQHNALFREPLFGHALKVYEQVKAVADELRRKPIEVALAWVLARENIMTAAVGTRHAGQVRQFTTAGDLELSPEHLHRLTAASDAFLAAKSRIH
ncbi:MAG: aldo/keto reductase [Nitrospinales bacterium]